MGADDMGNPFVNVQAEPPAIVVVKQAVAEFMPLGTERNGHLQDLSTSGKPFASGPPAPATGSVPGTIPELGGVHASRFKHHGNVFGGAPALGLLLGGGHHPSLQPPGLSPRVEGDHGHATLLGDPGPALAVRWAHRPSHVSFPGCDDPGSPFLQV